MAADSRVPTFAALQLYVDSWRWAGVPIFVRAGKKLSCSATEVIVKFKEAPQVVFPGSSTSDNNYVRFRMGPDVVIALGANTKAPGETMTGHMTELIMVTQSDDEAMDPYERLLGDAMEGDATMFARQDVVEAAWAIVDPLLNDQRTPDVYSAGGFGPRAADDLTASIGGWHDPK